MLMEFFMAFLSCRNCIWDNIIIIELQVPCCGRRKWFFLPDSGDPKEPDPDPHHCLKSSFDRVLFLVFFSKLDFLLAFPIHMDFFLICSIQPSKIVSNLPELFLSLLSLTFYTFSVVHFNSLCDKKERIKHVVAVETLSFWVYTYWNKTTIIWRPCGPGGVL